MFRSLEDFWCTYHQDLLPDDAEPDDHFRSLPFLIPSICHLPSARAAGVRFTGIHMLFCLSDLLDFLFSLVSCFLFLVSPLLRLRNWDRLALERQVDDELQSANEVVSGPWKGN